MRRAVVLVLGLACTARADLFSPGELSKAHAKLEGLSQCTQCHPAGGKLSQETCLTCHQELQPRVSKGLGLHGRLTRDARACETCHHEHQGAAAALIDWGARGEKGFEHQRSGWALEGAHRKVTCPTCHEPRLVKTSALSKVLERRPQSRLGLETNCAGCHFDEHRGQTKQSCETCHDAQAWRPAPGFNHDDTEYPLKGKHAKVKCAGCHDGEHDTASHGFPAPRSETFLRFAPVQHRTCLDCHRDPHEARFGLRCQSCHTVESWHALRNATQEREFHAKTTFPLEGAHLDVECVSCHGPSPGRRAVFKGLAHDACTSCHLDGHEGQLDVGGKPPDCARCHSVQGFTPVRFTLQDHGGTDFPLEGAHQVVPCAACHPATPALKARIPAATFADLRKRHQDEHFSVARFESVSGPQRCDTCHDDVHRGQFAGQRCEQCHDVARFTPSRVDHAKTRFPLEGAHAQVRCEGCHAPSSKGGAVKYRPLETSCQSCHADVHVGQLSAQPCEACHQTASWKPLGFSHAPPFTEFVLDGKHAEARCDACHAKVSVGPSLTATKYRGLPTTCEGCHRDFHQGAFRGFEP